MHEGHNSKPVCDFSNTAVSFITYLIMMNKNCFKYTVRILVSKAYDKKIVNN